ncbi:hypothetical protein ACWGLF_01870 [Streptomyces puniciscabiei]
MIAVAPAIAVVVGQGAAPQAAPGAAAPGEAQPQGSGAPADAPS